MNAKSSTNDLSLLLAAKVVDKFRKDAKLCNITESSIGTYLPLTHTYQLPMNISDDADETQKSQRKSYLREFELFVVLTQTLNSSIKRYKSSGEYNLCMNFCRLYPVTHFTVDKVVFNASSGTLQSIVPNEFKNNIIIIPSTPGKISNLAANESYLVQLWLLRSKYRALSRPSKFTSNITAPTEDSKEDPESDRGNLLETISSDRRVTARNILKWSQQLLTTLLTVHGNYMSVGDFTLEDVCLDSDRYVISALEQHKQLMFSNRDAPVEGPDRAENDLHANIETDSDRNAWLDIHNKLISSPHATLDKQALHTTNSNNRNCSPPKDRRATSPSKSATNTNTSSSVSAGDLDPLTIPKNNININININNNTSSTKNHGHDKLSRSSTADTFSVSALNPYTLQRGPSNSFDRQLLLQYDPKKTGSCTVQDKDRALPLVLAKYSDWMTNITLDLRCLGIVVLQMISHRVFLEPELKMLKALNSEPRKAPEIVAPSHIDEHPSSGPSSGPSSRRGSVVKQGSAGHVDEHATDKRRGSVKPDGHHPGGEHSSDRRGSVSGDRRGSVTPTHTAQSSDRRRGSIEKAATPGGSRRQSVTPDHQQPHKVEGDDHNDNFDVMVSSEAAKIRDKQLELEEASLLELEATLTDLYPAVMRIPKELKKLLLLCFQPPQIVHKTALRGATTMATRMECELFNKVSHLSPKIQSLVMFDYKSVHYEKKVYWTEEDEKRRVQSHKTHDAEMLRLTEQGLVLAAKRVREEKYKLWYSVQTPEYRARVEHIKRARAISKVHKAERKQHIYLASFHIWSLQEFETWLCNAFVRYCTNLYNMKIALDNVAASRSKKKKKPEVFQLRITAELFSPLDQNFTEKLIERYGQPSKQKRRTMSADGDLMVFNPDRIGSPKNTSLSPVSRSPEMSRSSSYNAGPMLGHASPQNSSRNLGSGMPKSSLSRQNSAIPALSSAMSVGSIRGSFSPQPLVSAMSNSNMRSSFSAAPKMLSAVSFRADVTNKSSSTLMSPLTKATSSLLARSPSTLARAIGSSSPVTATAADFGPIVPFNKKKPPKKISEGALLLNVVACIQILAEQLSHIVVGMINRTNDICSFIRLGQRTEKSDLAEVIAHILVTSDEQLYHKRMGMQATVLQKECKVLKKAVLHLCEEIGSMDRDWAKQILNLFTLSIANGYEEEIPIREQGEQIAALKVLAFFRMIHVRYKVRLIWQQTEAEYAQIVRKKKNAVPKVTSRQRSALSKSFDAADSTATLGEFKLATPPGSPKSGSPNFSAALRKVSKTVKQSTPTTPQMGPLTIMYEDNEGEQRGGGGGRERQTKPKVAAALRHRSFSEGNDEPTDLLPSSLPAIPHVMYAAEIHESVHHFDEVVHIHNEAVQTQKKSDPKLPVIGTDKPSTPANVKILTQPEPVSVSSVLCETYTMKVDLSFNLQGDNLHRTEEPNNSNKKGGGVHMDHSREYYKYDDWKTLTCAAYLVRDRAFDSGDAPVKNTREMFLSAGGQEVQYTPQELTAKYNHRDCTLPVLKSDQFVPDKLFVEGGLHDTQLSAAELLDSSLINGRQIPRVTSAVKSVESTVREVIIVMCSNKQVLYNLHSKNTDEYKAHPERYTPLPITFTVVKPPRKKKVPPAQPAPQTSDGKPNLFVAPVVEDRDYCNFGIRCVVSDITPNCNYRLSLQLDEYLSEDLVRDNHQYFDHLNLLGLLETQAVPFLAPRELVASKYHAKLQKEKDRERARLINNGSSAERAEALRLQSAVKILPVSIQYTHSGLSWLISRTGSAPKRLMLSLPEKMRTSPAAPSRLVVTSADIVYHAKQVEAAHSLDTLSTSKKISAGRKTPSHKGISLYFQPPSIADVTRTSSILTSYNSYIKVCWEKSRTDRDDKTSYQLQRRLSLTDSSDESGTVHEGEWESVIPFREMTDSETHSHRPAMTQTNHVHTYYTDCVCLPEFIRQSSLLVAMQYVCGRFAEIIAQQTDNASRAESDWLSGGLNVSCAYRVRAVNSYGVGNYSQVVNMILLGRVFISKSEMIEKGFYRSSHNHNVIQQAITQNNTNSHTRIQTPQTRLTTAQSIQSNLSEARDFFEFSTDIPSLPLTAYSSTSDFDSFGVQTDTIDNQFVAEGDEDEEWLRELAMACPIK